MKLYVVEAHRPYANKYEHHIYSIKDTVEEAETYILRMIADRPYRCYRVNPHYKVYELDVDKTSYRPARYSILEKELNKEI